MSNLWSGSVALITMTSMSDYLGIPTWGKEEEQVATLINAASQWALQFTGRTTFLQTSALTEYYDGDNSDILLTRATPINSVVSLYIDPDRDYGSETLLDSDEYAVYGAEGKIKTDGSLFTSGWKSIKLIYDAGYVREAVSGWTTMPWDIQWAIKELVTFWYERGTGHRVGVRSVNVGDKSTSYESDTPKTVLNVFNRYRLMNRFIA